MTTQPHSNDNHSDNAPNEGGGPRDPDFIIIGSMKAGTTTLYERLRAHPGVVMAVPKEPNYFSIDEFNERGPDWYRGLFAHARPDQLCGEASPSYTRHPRFPETAARMAAVLPSVKLVYILRHPVDRFYSNYVFDRAYGWRETIEETLAERPYVLETSRYLDQIKRYLEFYPRENLLCLLLDDLKHDPEGTLAKLADFLGAAPFPPVESVRHANPRGQQHAVRMGNRLLNTVRSAPGVGAASKLLPPTARESIRRLVTDRLPASRIGRWFARRRVAEAEPLTDAMRQRLHGLLDPSTTELEAFLGRDLSHWKATTPPVTES